MAKVTVKLNKEEIRNWLKSQEMLNMLQDRADSALASLPGCTTTQHVGKSRCNVAIETDTDSSYEENMNANTILKALR